MAALVSAWWKRAERFACAVCGRRRRMRISFVFQVQGTGTQPHAQAIDLLDAPTGASLARANRACNVGRNKAQGVIASRTAAPLEEPVVEDTFSETIR